MFPVPPAAIEAELLAEGRWSGELVDRERMARSGLSIIRWALQHEGLEKRIIEIDRDVTARVQAERREIDHRESTHRRR